MATPAELLRFEKATREKGRVKPVSFTSDAVEDAKKMVLYLAKSSDDDKVRRDAAQFIVEASQKAAEASYGGVQGALDELAGLPVELQRSALLMLYGRNMITKSDLDVILKIIAAAEQAKLEALMVQNAMLETEVIKLSELAKKGSGAKVITDDKFAALRKAGPPEDDKADESDEPVTVQ